MQGHVDGLFDIIWGACFNVGERQDPYTVSVGKPEGKIPLGSIPNWEGMRLQTQFIRLMYFRFYIIWEITLLA
jgi:hypothetical protein